MRPTDQDEYDVTASDQDSSGEMGVSSERVGPTGPGQVGTTGTRDVGPVDPADANAGDDPPPEQRPGGPEDNPTGIPPKAGYPSLDPRSDG